MRKIIGIILGILMCVGGFYCMLTPTITFSSLSIVFAITMIESAIAYFIIWLKIKKKNGSFTVLLNAILSLIAGITLLSNYFAQFMVEGMILTFVSLFAIMIGITLIVNAFKIKNTPIGQRWVLVLIVGILVLISGIISLTNPEVLAITIGIRMGMNIMTSGIATIIACLAVR